MKQYLEMLNHIVTNGGDKESRAGPTRGVFGYQFRHDLQEGFPLLTTKRMAWKSIVVELLWFLRGDTNIKYLLENNVSIWSADAYRVYKSTKKKGDTIVDLPTFEHLILTDELFARRWGDLGPIYGAQWRKWNHTQYVDGHWESYAIDQIENVIESIKTNPDGRRHIVTAWNPSEVDSMALPPCHCLFQFAVSRGKLSCHLYQRSADTFLGVPFNIASYALLTHIIAHYTGLKVGDLVISFGDLHIYRNHFNGVVTQLGREPRRLPKLVNYIDDTPIDQLRLQNFLLNNYDAYDAIKAELSVGV